MGMGMELSDRNGNGIIFCVCPWIDFVWFWTEGSEFFVDIIIPKCQIDTLVDTLTLWLILWNWAMF